MKKVKKYLSSQKLGDIYSADFKSMTAGPSIGYSAASDWHFNKAISGGGVIMDQGSHTIDLIRWLLGEIKSVFASKTDVFEDLKTDVCATILLALENNMNVSMHLSWVNGYTAFPISLWGTAGTIFVEPLLGHVEQVHGIRNPVKRWTEFTKTLIRFANQFLTNSVVDTHYPLINDFISSILLDRQPKVNINDGLKSIEIVDAIYRSISKNEQIMI